MGMGGLPASCLTPCYVGRSTRAASGQWRAALRGRRLPTKNTLRLVTALVVETATGAGVGATIDVTLVDDDGPPVNGSDAVFAAVATAAWHRSGWAPQWPTSP